MFEAVLKDEIRQSNRLRLDEPVDLKKIKVNIPEEDIYDEPITYNQ